MLNFPVVANAVRLPQTWITVGLSHPRVATMYARLAVSPTHPLARRRALSLADAAREPLLGYTREEYPDYYEHLDGIFAAVKKKPRVVEEHDGISSLLPAIGAGTGVALVAESIGRIAGQRVKLLRLTPKPKPVIIGIAAPEGQLTPAAEKFWQCAKQGAAAAANSRR